MECEESIKKITGILFIHNPKFVLSNKVRQRLVILGTAKANGFSIETAKKICDQLPHEKYNYWSKIKTK